MFFCVKFSLKLLVIQYKVYSMFYFRIQIKEKSAEEIRVEIGGLKEKNRRYQTRVSLCNF